MKVSVVICLYNEEENISPLIQSLDKALDKLDFEVVMVDDGSTDNTVSEITKNAKPWIKLIRLRKNYGQSSALAAGIDHALGEYIVTMDGDLQNDPADIPMMMSAIESDDYDMVAGYRKGRQDNLVFRKIPSMIANYLIRKATNIKIRDYGCTLKIFRSNVAKDLKLYGELHRFIPVLAALEGATHIKQVEVKHHPRKYGRSKYGMGRTLKVVSDLMLLLFFKQYMQRPMHLFGSLGIVLTVAGAGINMYLLVLKLLGNDIWGKPLLMLGILLFVAGIQMITIGLISELLMRTYYESQGKKPYNIKSIKGFEAEDQKVRSDNIQISA
jgi:glycosyltransferase involved in cell wall biosynthesis